MRDVLPEIERWRADGEEVVVATVVKTWGSAPRGVGARMAMTSSGKIAGSVSGGCVEGAVAEEGTRILATGKPKLLIFGVDDEKAWAVGLACGGTIEVFVEKLQDAAFEAIRTTIVSGRPVAEVTVVRGPDRLVGKKLVLAAGGSPAVLPGSEVDDAALQAAQDALASGKSRSIPAGETGAELFTDVILPPPRLIVVGGVHIAIPLVAIAKTLGYRTIVVDPRERFGSAERFPDVDRIVPSWPDRALGEIGIDSGTAVVVLTHDPKLDDPALAAALRSPAFYVGALGSRQTQEKRRQRLIGAGLDEEMLSRLHAPIGLPIGGRSPAEIALSIMAQIVATRNASDRAGAVAS